MCVIIFKDKGVNFPTLEALENCWNKNPHGAGFMISVPGEKVIIRKGFMTYSTFINSYEQYSKKYGEEYQWVIHFRISTGGKINSECTHPYPLSNVMEHLKATNVKCEIGVAHNGIISCCSGGIDYNDTMNFIANYLYYIIDGDKYYYKSKSKMTLIKKLCGSKLAILDNTGHCDLIGDGWITEKDGLIYSNSSYKKPEYFPPTYTGYYYKDYKYKNRENWEKYYDSVEMVYKFPLNKCPLTCDGTYKYCNWCDEYCDCRKIDD